MATIALVTGANRGMGKEVCRQLAQSNYLFLLAIRDLDKAKDAMVSSAMSSRWRGERCGF